MAKGFRDLQVWQMAKDLAIEILLLINQGDFNKDYGLKDQVRRAAVSVPSNIAEGDERNADRDSARFFRIAKGSIAELRTQLEIACEIGYMSREDFTRFDTRYDLVAKKLGALIKARCSVAP
jgi:four helix bundle protein